MSFIDERAERMKRLREKGKIPHLRGIFRAEEIDRRLLGMIILKGKRSFFNREKLFIENVARSGYKDEPKLDEDGVPLLQRTTPLHHLTEYAINTCDSIVVGNLFEIYDRFDLNYADEFGYTHFHVACKYGLERVVEKFLDHGQDPNCILPQTGDSPLHLALMGRDLDSLVELLLRRGADPNWANKEGSTALHIISKKRHFHECVLVKMLFELGDKKYQPLQINPQDNLGNTPLHMALSSLGRRNELVKLLLRIGANPNVANAEGCTPLQLLLNNYHDQFVKTFFEICAEKKQPLEVNAKDKLSRSPLQLAVENILPNAVDLLLNHGADLTDFVFPPASYFDDKPSIPNFEDRENFYHNYHLRIASGALTIAQRLKISGYELDRSCGLMIMKLFAKHELFEKPSDTEKAWCDDEHFTSKAKEIMVKPDLSLLDLVQLQAKEAAKLVTYADYFRLWSSTVLSRLSKNHRKTCISHLIEKLSRRFFREWALKFYCALVRYRLPKECCEIIIDDSFTNQHLYNICLAAAGQNKKDGEKDEIANEISCVYGKPASSEMSVNK